MTIWQTLKIVGINISKNKMRAFLTMLGMIMGVTSVIILVSIMQGYFNDMLDSFVDMGINNVSVTLNGRNGNVILSEADMYQYAKDHKASIKGVTPTFNFQTGINKGGEKIDYVVYSKGVDEFYTGLVNKEIEVGHTITYSDVATRQKVCVIGSYVNQRLFRGNARVGDTLSMNGEELTVIGVLKTSSDASEWSSDNCLYMPYTTAMRLYGVGSIGSYEFFIKDRSQVGAETAVMKDYLFGIYRDTKAYKVNSMVDTLKQVDEIVGIFTVLIAGIAGISLAVAGVGIMNIMLVSVSERIKEIGIRKSLGAKYRDIMRQFVFEAAATSTMGGILGILIGISLTSPAGTMLGFAVEPTTTSIILSFCVSVGIGVLFGYLPARKAAKLNPIDALRNE